MLKMISTFLLGSVILLQTDYSVAQDSAMAIKKFELKTCRTEDKKCVRIRAQEASSGQFTPIMILKNIELTVTPEGNRKTIKLEGAQGYIDLNLNRIVLKTSPKNEVSFDLNDFSSQEFKL